MHAGARKRASDTKNHQQTIGVLAVSISDSPTFMTKSNRLWQRRYDWSRGASERHANHSRNPLSEQTCRGRVAGKSLASELFRGKPLGLRRPIDVQHVAARKHQRLVNKNSTG